ncbi:hypothetical protein PMAYCL1PPCAC_31258, partial [Pristionchus mayeri]
NILKSKMAIRTEVKGAAYWITFDNEKRKNALSSQMYIELCQAMDEANAMEEILVTVITGSGEYFSSGKDFSPEEAGKVDYKNLDYELGGSRFLRRIIGHTKVIIGLVNGPAIGIGCTMLGLFDYLVCSDSAYFLTPFTKIGITPEGTSSAVFERIIGTSNATEMLLFGEAMSAKKALDCGFVSHVFPKAEFSQKAGALIEKLAKLPKHSVIASKELCRGQKWRRDILSIHNEESDRLRKMFVHEDTIKIIESRYQKAKM